MGIPHTTAPLTFVAIIAYFALATTVSSQAAKTKLFFKGDICLEIASDAPEVLEIRTTRRLSLRAQRDFDLNTTTFRLSLPAATEPVSLGIISAYPRVQSDNRRNSTSANLGDCDFIDGPEGFKQQVDGVGLCSLGIDQVYHSAPGDTDNIIVRCRAVQPDGCQSMRLTTTVEDVTVRVRATIDEPDPVTWRPLAAELRGFLTEHATLPPKC